MQYQGKNISYFFLALSGIGVAFMLALISPIEQSQEYHSFSDTMTLFKVANFWNVVSNIPFTIVGVLGIYKLKSIAKDSFQYFILFIGVIFMSFGSIYYHLNPDNNTLVWDRLPMVVVFMTLFSIVISEFINSKIGKITLFPALLLGVFSVLYWIFYGDLRLYAFVEFYPMLAIPIILIFYKSKYKLSSSYWFY